MSKKISKEEASEMKNLIAKSANTDEYKKKAEELNVEIPSIIIDNIEKWENRSSELAKNGEQYSDTEHNKSFNELYGKDRSSGTFGRFLRWIDRITS